MENRFQTRKSREGFSAPFGSFAGLAFWLDVTREWHDGREGLW